MFWAWVEARNHFLAALPDILWLHISILSPISRLDPDGVTRPDIEIGQPQLRLASLHPDKMPEEGIGNRMVKTAIQWFNLIIFYLSPYIKNIKPHICSMTVFVGTARNSALRSESGWSVHREHVRVKPQTGAAGTTTFASLPFGTHSTCSRLQYTLNLFSLPALGFTSLSYPSWWISAARTSSRALSSCWSSFTNRLRRDESEEVGESPGDFWMMLRHIVFHVASIYSDWWFGTFGSFSIQLGVSSSQLTNSIIFQSCWLKPPTSYFL